MRQLLRNGVGEAKRDKIRGTFLFPMRKIATRLMNIRVFIEAAEDSHFAHTRNTGLPACAATGHFVRCFGFTGVKLRWPHRLQVCVPDARTREEIAVYD